MVIKQDIYDGSLIHKRFAYKFFKHDTLATGNLVVFRAPMNVTTNLIDLEDSMSNDYIWSDDAINFCWEIPMIDNAMGAVAFQRLFNTQIATILHKYINAPIEMKGDHLIVHKEHDQGGIVQQKGKASVSITHVYDRVALGHTAINITAGKKAPAFAFSTKLTNAEIDEFIYDVSQAFYNMCDDMFVATTKIQIS